MICFTLVINSKIHQSAKRNGSAPVPLLTPTVVSKPCWTLIHTSRFPVTKMRLGLRVPKPD